MNSCSQLSSCGNFRESCPSTLAQLNLIIASSSHHLLCHSFLRRYVLKKLFCQPFRPDHLPGRPHTRSLSSAASSSLPLATASAPFSIRHRSSRTLLTFGPSRGLLFDPIFQASVPHLAFISVGNVTSTFKAKVSHLGHVSSNGKIWYRHPLSTSNPNRKGEGITDSRFPCIHA